MAIEADRSATRREFLRMTATIGAVVAAKTTPLRAQPQPPVPTTQPRPNPATFQSGDFVWPKAPGKWVPYDSAQFQERADAKRDWIEQRNSFVKSVRQNAGASEADRHAAATLESMEFSEFLALYLADQKPGIPGEYGGAGSPLYVGHVGILQVTPEGSFVIEAVTDHGHKVRSVSYQQWLVERPDDNVWHGRLKDHDAAARATIVAYATTQIEKPYGFWNFDLNDDTKFYCSKLVWQCVFRKLGFAVDANPNPRRGFWFSPKQLMNCAAVQMLNIPGSYTHS